jgi:hypothetical protein
MQRHVKGFICTQITLQTLSSMLTGNEAPKHRNPPTGRNQSYAVRPEYVNLSCDYSI